MLQKLNRTHV